MNWNVLTVIWGEPNPLERGQLNQLQLSGLSSQISGLVDLGWGTGKCILKMTYSDSDVGNTLKQDVRKTMDSCFSNGWMILIAHRSQAASFATATAASLQPVLLQHLQKSLMSPDPEFRTLLPHCTKLPQRKHIGQLLYYCWQALKFAQNLYKWNPAA